MGFYLGGLHVMTHTGDKSFTGVPTPLHTILDVFCFYFLVVALLISHASFL